MPRVILPEHPQVHFAFTEYPNDVNDVHSYAHYLEESEGAIVKLWQEWKLVHDVCPRKLCARYGVKCKYYESSDKLKCPQCDAVFPSRPSAFKNLSGTHKDLFKRLFYFSGDMNRKSIKNLTGDGHGKQRRFKKRMHAVIITGIRFPHNMRMLRSKG